MGGMDTGLVSFEGDEVFSAPFAGKQHRPNVSRSLVFLKDSRYLNFYVKLRSYCLIKVFQLSVAKQNTAVAGFSLEAACLQTLSSVLGNWESLWVLLFS
jgi:hypothetical protein